jgi:hypothetical protein
MDTRLEKEYLKGGEFLIADQTAAEVFTPEDFTDEHRMIGDTCRQYIDNEVVPNLPKLEAHEWDIARGLLQKAGELGLHHCGNGGPGQRIWLDLRSSNVHRTAANTVLGIGRTQERMDTEDHFG